MPRATPLRLAPLRLTRRALAAALLFSLALALGPGCIFFVPDAPGLETTTCHFQGETTACGSCIAASCQPAVNSCCGDSGCKGQLTSLDQCAQDGAASSCSALATSSSSTLTTLGDCVLSSCPACFTGTGTTANGDITCSADSSLCTCALVGGYGDGTIYDGTMVPTCSEATLPGFTCCAQSGWPSSLSSCNCLQDYPSCGSTTVHVPSCGP